MTASVPVWTNVKSWKREMKWMRLLQTRNAGHDACTQMLVRSPVIVLARARVSPTCPRCTALWLLELHDLVIKFYISIMHEILNSNTMTMEDQKTFGEMLRFIFSNPKEDIHIQRGLPTDGSDGSSVSILKSKFGEMANKLDHFST